MAIVAAAVASLVAPFLQALPTHHHQCLYQQFLGVVKTMAVLYAVSETVDMAVVAEVAALAEMALVMALVGAAAEAIGILRMRNPLPSHAMTRRWMEVMLVLILLPTVLAEAAIVEFLLRRSITLQHHFLHRRALALFEEASSLLRQLELQRSLLLRFRH